MTSDYKDWCEGWIKEGYFLAYRIDDVVYYEQVVARDFAHWEYTWEDGPVQPGQTGGPIVLEDLEITRGYEKNSRLNNIWQIIFGIKGQVYVYIEHPPDVHRHGIAKVPKPSATLREVSHYTEWMSPWKEPTFLTEHFLMRGGYERINFDVYNPENIAITPQFNFFLSKMQTERIGTLTADGQVTITKNKFQDIMDKLLKRLVPYRPISIQPVSLPPSTPSGE